MLWYKEGRNTNREGGGEERSQGGGGGQPHGTHTQGRTEARLESGKKVSGKQRMTAAKGAEYRRQAGTWSDVGGPGR